LYAVDWENHVEAPCDDIEYGPNEIIVWDGPYEMTFCTDSIFSADSDIDLSQICPSGCCYTVVYYDTWAEGDYMAYIAGIFWEESDDCYSCDKSAIEEYFFWKLIQDQNDQAFKDKIEENHGMDALRITMHLWTPGHCYQSLEPVVYCENERYCCWQGYTVGIRPVPNGPDSLDITEKLEFEPGIFQYECDTACIEVCSDYRYEPMPACEMPCNKTAWVLDQKESGVSVPGCPDCEITIHYKYRTTQDPECDPSFNDYEITEIDMSDPDCSNCPPMTAQEIFQFGISYLLKYGPIDPPDDTECDINWRIVNATCWKLFPDGTFAPCEADGCCWSQYEICNNGGVLTYTKIGGSSTQDTCWQILTHICGFVCDLLPEPIYQDPSGIDFSTEKMSGKYSYAVPNPSSESTEILFDYTQLGKVELTVFDKLGSEVLKAKFEKTGKIIKMPIKNVFSSGVYSYKIRLNNKTIDNGSFVVIK